jgi:sulfide dehydrogenase [flavocytochrome c] flavoprotein chain
MAITRRAFIQSLGMSLAAGAVPITGRQARAASVARVVVIGGGFGGATAAKYCRMWGNHIDITLVERNPNFISCPISNLVVGGIRTMAQITKNYDKLASQYGIKIVQAEVTGIDVDKRKIALRSGASLDYDRVIVAPGVDFMWELVPSMGDLATQDKILHAWKAGPQTLALRKQLEDMQDGGIFAISIPKAPYRCPPGPYERACQVANYFKKSKPKSKVLILDSNEDVVSKKALFTKAWRDLYPGIIEYRSNSELQDVDAKTMTLKLQFEDVKADVINVVPPVRAGNIAQTTGLITANKRWCEVDWLTYESKVAKNVHIVGDAILAGNLMPKSGHMANQHAKACAAAVVALLSDQPVFDYPTLANTCYSFISDTQVIHVASVHQYHADKKTMLTVEGSGGVSAAASELEASYADSWANNIWADMLG